MKLQQTLDKISDKAKKCDCRLAIIANVLATEDYKITKHEENNIKICVVPSLLQYSNDIITVDENAKDYIRRCLNEYTN